MENTEECEPFLDRFNANCPDKIKNSLNELQENSEKELEMGQFDPRKFIIAIKNSNFSVNHIFSHLLQINQ